MAEANDPPPHGILDRGDTAATSSNRLLAPTDLEKFRPGRPIEEVLNDVQWRGNFEMAYQREGTIVSVISFELIAIDAKAGDGEVIWAIFVAGKFEKFVPWTPAQMETVNYEGVPASRPKPFRLGDFSRLSGAVEQKPLSKTALAKDTKSKSSVPSQIDPGLTIAWLIFGAGRTGARKDDYKKNHRAA